MRIFGSSPLFSHMGHWRLHITHKDRNTQMHRIYLRPSTVYAVRAMALATGRADEWNMVADDCMAVGAAYLNRVGKMELAEWSGKIVLADLEDVDLRIIKGALPLPEER